MTHDLPDNLTVLKLVTTPRPFFEQQCTVLAERGVDITVQQVPGRESADDTRSVLDYAKFYPGVLRKTFHDFDIIHANYGLTAPMALAQPRRPVVLTLWGSDLMGPLGWVGKYSARFSTEVIVRNEEMRQKLDRDAHVIQHGVDLERFQPQPQNEARNAVDWDPDKKHVLFPYRPDRSVKNHPLAKQVVDEADDRLSDPVSLQVVHGIPHDEVPMYMNAADVLLVTSEREGSPNTVKEAMACNLPVVSTDVGDVRNRLNGVTPGGVCQDTEALIDTLVSVLSAEARSNGRTVISELSLDQMAEQLLAVYEKAYTG